MTHSRHRTLLQCFLAYFLSQIPCNAKITRCKLKNEIYSVQVINGKFGLTHDHSGNTRYLRSVTHFPHNFHLRDLNLDGSSTSKTNDNIKNSNNNIFNEYNSTDNGYDNNTFNTYNARECPCAFSYEPTYCLITSQSENQCEVSESRSHTLCYHTTSNIDILHNFWPVVVVWYIAVIVYVVCTKAGRGTVQYLCAKLFCKADSYMRNLSGIILDREQRERRNRLETHRALRMRDNVNVTYLLKTKIYSSDTNTDIIHHRVRGGGGSKVVSEISPTAGNLSSTPVTSSCRTLFSGKHDGIDIDDEAEQNNDNPMTNVDTLPPTNISYFPIKQNLDTSDINQQTTFNDLSLDPDNDGGNETCTICMIPFDNGDRIGALQCDHKFHVECLKEWIKRRNVCPLCQKPDIAEIRLSVDSNNENLDSISGPTTTNSTITGSLRQTSRRTRSPIRSSTRRTRASWNFR